MMTVAEIKHQFMALRNGIVADTLRKAGFPYHVVFGLQLPQLGQIAASVREDASDEALSALADTLWQDREVRESRLLATWLFNPATLTRGEALAMAADTRTAEEADILVFRLLRHTPYAAELPDELDSVAPQCAVALRRFL